MSNSDSATALRKLIARAQELEERLQNEAREQTPLTEEESNKPVSNRVSTASSLSFELWRRRSRRGAGRVRAGGRHRPG
jgi:hypothetical protein